MGFSDACAMACCLLIIYKRMQVEVLHECRHPNVVGDFVSCPCLGAAV